MSERTLGFLAQCLIACLMGAPAFGADVTARSISQYDVVWDSPSADSKGSMPLGNGEIGLNVWAEKSGDIYVYLGRTDAWNGNHSLMKIGKVQFHITPNPFSDCDRFEQRLDLANGEIHISSSNRSNRLDMHVRVDANHPVIHVSAESTRPVSVTTSLRIWRTRARQLTGTELHTAYGLINAPFPVMVQPDTVLTGQQNEILWAYRNNTSIWRETLTRQGMGEWAGTATDPLLDNTFGGLITGDSMVSASPTELASERPARSFHVCIYAHTRQCRSLDDWKDQIHEIARRAEAIPAEEARIAHRAYWRDFWERSWIFIDGSPEAVAVSRSYALQRFISGCAGRGVHPQKFNGSLFTVDSMQADSRFDADYRRWGGPFWLQNTRLIYWPILHAGDYELMAPLFRMYSNALPYARAVTRRYYGHDGAFFPETMYFWGSYVMDNFGWNTSPTPFTHIENQYIRYYYQGGLEISAMMLEYYRHTLDEKFARDILLPFAHQVILFYALHYPRDEAGKIRIYPSQALETFWDAENPTSAIAGLRWNLAELLKLPGELFTPDQAAFFTTIAEQLPDIPLGQHQGKDVVLPAGKIFAEPHNIENPEFYAIFPYRFFGVGKPDLERMKNSYVNARIKFANGWCQYDVNAAFLGIADSARAHLVKRAAAHHPGSRFPAFWGPNYDWIPDQDHGSNILICVQAMLLQADGDDILLFPAWPADWNVSFKLHAPGRTTIQAELQDGALVNFQIEPESRKADVRFIGSDDGSKQWPK
ncbi:MAG: DUF5703 domain-containing protein [Candidatus Zhuqueibacterota bacterium]